MLYLYISIIVCISLWFMAEVTCRTYHKRSKKLLHELWWLASLLGGGDAEWPVSKQRLLEACKFDIEKFNVAVDYLSMKGIILAGEDTIRFTRYGLLYYHNRVKPEHIMR